MPPPRERERAARLAGLRTRGRRLILPLLTGVLVLAWSGYGLTYVLPWAADHQIVVPGFEKQPSGEGPLVERWHMWARQGILDIRWWKPHELGFLSGQWEEGPPDYRMFFIDGEGEAHVLWNNGPNTVVVKGWLWEAGGRFGEDNQKLNGVWPLCRFGSDSNNCWLRVELWPLLVLSSCWLGWRWRRRWLLNRALAGRCTRCGYNLAGLSTNALCPECGRDPLGNFRN